MRILSFLLLIALMARPAMAFDRLSDTFDPSALNFQEKRILQAMLVLEGTYVARLDGAWGRGSQGALEKALVGKFGDGPVTWARVARLAKSAKAEMKPDRWKPVFVERTGTSYLLPRNVVDSVISSDTSRFGSTEANIRARSFTSNDLQSQLVHRQLVARSDPRHKVYSVARPTLRITSARLRDGTYAYLRSEAVQGGFANTIVEWSQADARKAQLIVSSIKQGKQEDLQFLAGSLRRAVNRLDKPRKPAKDPVPKPQDQPEQPQGDYTLRGVGIYVNNTDLLVAQSAMEACETGLMLADGTKLAQLENLPILDLVVLTSGARSPNWIRVYDGDLPEDTDLSAIYLPFNSWRQSVSASANARILGGFSYGEGKTKYLTALPGRSPFRGAPLLNKDGDMVGVLLGAPDLNALTGSRGRASREFSVAISTKPLSPMLHRRGVVHQRQATKASTTATDPTKAIVPVVCAR
jgi:hypothetical protein